MDFIDILLDDFYYAFRERSSHELPDCPELAAQDLSLLRAICFASQNNFCAAVEELEGAKLPPAHALAFEILDVFKTKIQLPDRA